MVLIQTAVAVLFDDVSRAGHTFDFCLIEDLMDLSVGFVDDRLYFVELFEEGRLFRSSLSASFDDSLCVRCGLRTNFGFVSVDEFVPETTPRFSFESLAEEVGRAVLELEGFAVRFAPDFEDVPEPFALLDEVDRSEPRFVDDDVGGGVTSDGVFLRLANIAGLGVDIGIAPFQSLLCFTATTLGGHLAPFRRPAYGNIAGRPRRY